MIIDDIIYFFAMIVLCLACLMLGQTGLILLLINIPMILTLFIVQIVQIVYLIKSCCIPFEVRSFAYYYEMIDKLELKDKGSHLWFVCFDSHFTFNELFLYYLFRIPVLSFYFFLFNCVFWNERFGETPVLHFYK